ncbi:hypothetical protein [Brevundimonas lenta]|uniref:Uncharacterized protein n=1 Tax=Brevundimonas lenta TaxID=424796 RepID=A0A7W6JD44_9CAUL|nr:hypothetical protein [Brevundimonas lenta]MBB4082841.1 hypothetical protein [Brevundimonas lenta]
MTRHFAALASLVVALTLAWATPVLAALPSWNDTAAKQAIPHEASPARAPGLHLIPSSLSGR